MIAIFKKEIHTFLNSLIGYLVMAVFLLVTGLLVWVFPETSILNYGYADMSTFFFLAPYILLFMVPAITMRMFAEERKTGTIEFLFTKPVSELEVIIGKYLAGTCLVVITVIPTFIYAYSLYQLSIPKGNIDMSGIIGSYIGLILLASSFVAIGLFTSTLSGNQIVSFLLGCLLCFFIFYGFGSISQLNEWSVLLRTIEKLGVAFHYDALSKGVIDLTNIAYFIGLISVMLVLTHISINSRKW